MDQRERRELVNYFRLSDYRDGSYFLLEEYLELREIVKNNSTARELEDYRDKYLTGKISEDQYNEKVESVFNQVMDNGPVLKKTKKQ